MSDEPRTERDDLLDAMWATHEDAGKPMICASCLESILPHEPRDATDQYHKLCAPTVSKPDVPRATVEALAANIKELLGHHARQSVVQAKLLRWCVWAINQTTAEAERALERERRNHPNPNKRRVYMHEPSRKVREDKAKALLYLEWLATQMENRGPAEP